MKKTPSIYYASFVCLLIVAILAACTGKPVTIDCATPKDFCVGLVTQLGKINDQALNQMTWAGIEKARLKFGIHAQYIETVDSRDYDKNISTFANAGYDLIITVGYDQSKATIAAARKYSKIKFIGVDQPLEQDKSLPQNLAGLAFAEDQLGFLAGVLATQMTKLNKVGAVCGPDSFSPAWRYCEGFKAGVQYINAPPEEPTLDGTATPAASTLDGLPTPDPLATPQEQPTLEDAPTLEEPTPDDAPEAAGFTRKQHALEKKQEELPTGTPTPEVPISETPAATETPTVEAIVVYHNEIGFKDSLDDPKWDAETANKLIDDGVDVIFGADSYEENGAISAAAKRRIYAIGVNTDQYFTIIDARNMLVSSVVKEIEAGVFDLIKAAKGGTFPMGNILGKVGYAPYHDFSERIPGYVTQKLTEIEKGLANGSIETGVFWRKP